MGSTAQGIRAVAVKDMSGRSPKKRGHLVRSRSEEPSSGGEDFLQRRGVEVRTQRPIHAPGLNRRVEPGLEIVFDKRQQLLHARADGARIRSDGLCPGQLNRKRADVITPTQSSLQA